MKRPKRTKSRQRNRKVLKRASNMYFNMYLNCWESWASTGEEIIDSMLVNGMYNPFNLGIVDNNDTELTVKALLPGVRQEDINLTIKDGCLVLAASGKEIGTVSYSVALGEGLITKNPTATLKDGVLTVVFQKKKPEQISIKIGG